MSDKFDEQSWELLSMASHDAIASALRAAFGAGAEAAVRAMYEIEAIANYDEVLPDYGELNQVIGRLEYGGSEPFLDIQGAEKRMKGLVDEVLAAVTKEQK